MHARWENGYCIVVKALCETVDLLFLSTSSQVESLHSDIVGNFSSYKEKYHINSYAYSIPNP